MSDEAWDQLEERLAAASRGAPAALRAKTLAAVQRELRAARWDRRGGRLAAACVALGIALNLTLALGGESRPALGDVRARESLVATAAAVAEATDVETALRMARQLAALGGRSLSEQDAAAIDAAIREDAASRG